MSEERTFSPESISGMHVRLPENHILLAKITAKAANLTLASYIDGLIVADATRILADPVEAARIVEDIGVRINELNHERQVIADLGK